MSILVIGSFVMDLVVRTPRAPENGETIIGSNFARFPGGKGANQAVSAARLDGEVTMAGKVGNDSFGDEAIETLSKEKINVRHMLRDVNNATGVGLVTLEDDGNNRIVVVPGANLSYRLDELDKIRNVIRNSKILVLQLEMDFKMTEQAIKYAFEENVPVILNPAPANFLSDDILSKVSYLTPNETETEILTGVKVNTLDEAKEAGKILIEKGVQNVIMTLGENGAFVINKTESYHVPGFKVKTNDTVAAGDAFNGALAVGIVNGKPLKENVKYANAVGAITVTREGAIPSLPTTVEVERFIKEMNKKLV